MNTLLIIEDTRELSDIVRRELEQVGYRCLCSPDGMDGLEQFQRSQPDLVILDWMLPNMDGLEVLRNIRKTSAVPVLMLTARSGLSDRVVGLELGADDYLVKPFEIPELIARIHALLRRTGQVTIQVTSDQSKAQATIKWEEVELDPEAYICRICGQQVDLTHIEFELLHLLIRNPGRTFTRRYLQETIWNQPFLDGDRSADNTVMRLRRKLGIYAESLETIRGVGYRLNMVRQ